MEYIVILMFASSFLGWLFTWVSSPDSEFPYNLIGCLLSVCIPIVLVLCITFNQIEPTALDVYRGKTTLKITYRDSIPVDSIVVFK